MDVLRSPALQRRLPSNSMLRARIAHAVQLGQDPDQAEMGLSILGRNVVIEDPGAPPSDPELIPATPHDPDEPGDELQRLIQQMAGVINLLTEISQVPPNKPGNPRSILNQLTTSSAEYVTLASWIIPPDRVGSLQEISFGSDTPATAQFKLTINNVVQWQDELVQTSIEIPFRENELPGDTEILIEVQSDGVATIIAEGSIAGVEREP